MIHNAKQSLFKQSFLATMLSLCSFTTAFAMQQLSDASMSDMTGEGVALLPESFKMVFQMPNDSSKASSYNRTDIKISDPSIYDTGFIRIIPVGEDYTKYTGLTQEQLNNKQSKADIFIYGLALSKSNDNANSRFGNIGFNWGSDANPWVVRSGTENVRQFKDAPEEEIGYFSIETPLAAANSTGNAEDRIKLGLWLDAFSRKWNSSNEVDPITGAPSVASDLTTDQRLRLQVVANGLSMNGSQVRFFQTQSSVGEPLQPDNTLGFASILRLNTNNDPSALRYENSTANATSLANHALRISTATSNDGTASTPALDRSFAPIFDEKEGLYLYSPNINLVLGNMYQPFIVGSEGNNIVLEVTAIPNVPAIYNKIYTDYTSETSRKATLCNVTSCGSNTKDIAGNIYQGNNATHSSISIGSVGIANNMLEANKTKEATGIVFRGIAGSTDAPVNLGSVAIDGVLIQHLKFKTTGL